MDFLPVFHDFKSVLKHILYPYLLLWFPKFLYGFIFYHFKKEANASRDLASARVYLALPNPFMVKREIFGYLSLVFLSRSIFTLVRHAIWYFRRDLAMIKSYIVFPEVKYLKNLAVCIINYCIQHYRNGFTALRGICLLMELNCSIRKLKTEQSIICFLCLLNIIRGSVSNAYDCRREFTIFIAAYTLTTPRLIQNCTPSLIINIQGWLYVDVEVYRDCHGNVSVILAKVLLVKIVIIQEPLVRTFDLEVSPSSFDEYPSFPLAIEDVETESETDEESEWSCSDHSLSFYRRGPLSTIEEFHDDISDTQSTADYGSDHDFRFVLFQDTDSDSLECTEFENYSDRESEYYESSWDIKEVDDDKYRHSEVSEHESDWETESEYSDFSWDVNEVENDSYSQSEYSDYESDLGTESIYSDDGWSVGSCDCEHCRHGHQTLIYGTNQVLGKRPYDAITEDEPCEDEACENEVSEEMLSSLHGTY